MVFPTRSYHRTKPHCASQKLTSTPGVAVVIFMYQKKTQWRKELSHKHTCIHSSPNSSPIQAATKHWAEFHVLNSRSLLLVHFKHSNVFTWLYHNIVNQLCIHAQLLQSCSTLCNLMDYSPPDSSVHGILQVRILEWVSMPSSWGSSQPRNQTSISSISYIVSGFFTHWATGKSLIFYTSMQNYKFKKEEETNFLSFHYVRIQPEVSCLKIRKRALTRHWIYETWIWNTPASRTVRNINNYLLFQNNNNSMKLLADTQHFG